MSRPRKCPEELLERGVRLALESGRPIAHVARDLGIRSETLRKRVRQAQADSGVFAFVIDAFSRKVVGWQLAAHMRTDLVLDALEMALGQRGGGADIELIHHSDRGSQYTSIDYGQMFDDHGMLASVGSVGDAHDNALAESFVDSFKTELIADRVWRNRSQLELAIVEYLGWFNNARLHASLGDIPRASSSNSTTTTDTRVRSHQRA